MSAEEVLADLGPDEPPPAHADEQPAEDWDEWCDVPPAAAEDDEVWKALELDEETAEPEPEYGDFWGRLDDEEEV